MLLLLLLRHCWDFSLLHVLPDTFTLWKLVQVGCCARCTSCYCFLLPLHVMALPSWSNLSASVGSNSEAGQADINQEAGKSLEN